MKKPKPSAEVPKQPKAPPGRPPHVPTPATRAVVCDSLARGLGLEKIAQALNLGSHHTIEKHYAEEIKARHQYKAEKTEATIRNRAYGFYGPDRRYYPPSESMLKMLAERDLGWTEKSTHVLTGPGGGPVEVVTKTREEQISRFKRLVAPTETPQQGGPGGQKPPASGD